MKLLDPAAPDPGGPWRDIVREGIPLRIFTGPQKLVLDAAKETHPSDLTPSPAPDFGDVVSTAVLTTLAKAFDDGLVAAVELWLQDHGTRGMLDAVGRVHPVVDASAEIGGGRPVQLGDTEAASVRDSFLSDDRRSKPIGFYTWSEALTRVFRQDRLLQSPLRPALDERVAALVRALHAVPDQRHVYERTLRVAERLTNPFVTTDLRPWLRSLDAGFTYRPPDTLAWLPASTSHEVRLAQHLLGDRPAPEGFDLMNELVRQVRAGTITLEPGPSSGWYDHQTWAQAALLTFNRNDEAAKLKASPRYLEHLEALFKGAMTVTRETHVKQLRAADVATAMGGGGDIATPRPVVVVLMPDLDVEPLVSHYDRRASAYRFVRRLLESELGLDALATMRRMTPVGPVTAALDQELADMERLFEDAAGLARVGLGLATSIGDDAADAFARRVRAHPDVRRDTRAMVPVFYDLDRRQTKVWCLLGWTQRGGRAQFDAHPLVRCRSNATCELVSLPKFFWLAEPLMVEVYTNRVLDRDEFRQLCDRERTADRIVSAIEALT